MSRKNDLPSLWSGLDRKAMAVAEFTLRQQRKRLSTWVVLLVGIAAMGVLTMFYIDSMTRDYEAVDNDGDSYDWDGDGYPNGQERLYGTDILDMDSHPGLLDPPSFPMMPAFGSTKTILTGLRWKKGALATTTTEIVTLRSEPIRKKMRTETVSRAISN
jgi:hypothetical protein